MKKILLGTTGLVAVAMIATAASAETPKVTLGGFSDFQSGWTNDDKDSLSRTNGFRNDNEITVKVDGKTAGGLGYGAQIDLEADTTEDTENQGLNASRTFTYLDSKFGRVELGGNKSVASTMRVDASTLAAATGGINGAWTYFVNGTNDSAFISTSKLVAEHGDTTAFGDESTYNATKVSYYTPKFSGFQAGVSYTPQIEDRGQDVLRSEAGFSDVIDLGLGYEGTFSGVKLAASGTYEMATGDNGTTTSGVALTGVDDINAWNVGALAGYKGFSLAASYGDWRDSGFAGLDGDYYTAGAAYAAGPVAVSATYLDSDLGGNEFSNLVVGAEYKLAAGLTPYAEVSFYEFDSVLAADDNEGTTFILGTQVAF